MRKSIALLLGLSLATLTACGQTPGNSGAASSDSASAVISEAASDAAPATAETPAASSRDTTTEQRNVLDGFVDFSADTAGGSLKCARAAAVLVEYLSCADIDASTAADWMTDLTQQGEDHRQQLSTGRAFWPMPKTSPPIQPARPTFYPAPVSPRILPAWF